MSRHDPERAERIASLLHDTYGAVFDFTIEGGKICEIDLIADLALLEVMDVAILRP